MATPLPGIDPWFPGARLLDFFPPQSQPTLTVPATPGVYSLNKFSALIPNASDSITKASNTATIQAVIDNAYANGYRKIYLTDGIFWCNPGIFLDAPGNLRSNPANPTIFSFSLSIEGTGADPNNNFGTELHFSDATAPWLIVGTGQYMRVAGLNMQGPIPTSRAALPVNGAGIAIGSGSAGSAGITIEHCIIQNTRAAVLLGYNNINALGDNVVLNRCAFFNNYYGYACPTDNQGYIHSLFHCHMADNSFHVYLPLGKQVGIYGGNYSGTNSHSNTFTIGSTTVLSTLADNYFGNSFNNWTFSTTLSADDQPMKDGAYDRFCLSLPHYGLVPLVLQSYNSSTKLATFKFYGGWIAGVWQNWVFNYDLLNNSDIQTEIQAATSLYAAETETTFYGTATCAYNVHLESPNIPCRIFACQSGFGGMGNSLLRGANFNFDCSQGGAAIPVAYNQACWPTFYMAQGTLLMEECNYGAGAGVNMECVQGQQIKVIGIPFLGGGPNILQGFGSGGNDGLRSAAGTGVGGGRWYDGSPQVMGSRNWYGYGNPANSNPIAGCVFDGYFPSPNQFPHINSNDWNSAYVVTPGAVGGYPPMCGGVMYLVGDHMSLGFQGAALSATAQQPNGQAWAISSHAYFSWGINLPSNSWNYKGGSFIVNVTSTANLFPGLAIILNNGTSGDQLLLITGVYPLLNYITVRGLVNGVPLAGVKTTVYTATLIKQQAYNISTKSNWPALKTVTNSGAGSISAASGDMTGGDHTVLTLPNIGTGNYTMRSTSALIVDMNNGTINNVLPAPNTQWIWRVRNTGAGTITVVAGDGTQTISGTATIASGAWRDYAITFPTTATSVIVSLGSGSI